MTSKKVPEDDFYKRPRFKDFDEFQAYRKACAQESQRAVAAKKHCPLRKDDQLFARSVQVGSKWILCDIVVRTEGTIEFWVKQYKEREPIEPNGTHRSFTLVLELEVKKSEEANHFHDPYW